MTHLLCELCFLKKDSLEFVCLAVSVFISLQHENSKRRQVLLNIFLGNKSPQSHTIPGIWLDSQDSLHFSRNLVVKSLCKHPMNWGIHLCIVRLITVQGRNPTNHHKGLIVSLQNTRFRIAKEEFIHHSVSQLETSPQQTHLRNVNVSTGAASSRSWGCGSSLFARRGQRRCDPKAGALLATEPLMNSD